MKSSLANQINQLSVTDKKEILTLLEEREAAHLRETCQENFLPFVKAMWSAFIEGEHHSMMADMFDRVAKGELKRIIINMPPRHTKSEFASHYLPAWFLGNYPDKKVIQTAHTAELSVGFGRKVRNLVNSGEFKKVFPK